MAAFDFSAAQAVASMAEEQQASVPIQSLVMQINADAVCLVRTQFQYVKTKSPREGVLVVVHPSFRRGRRLKWRNRSGILKPLSVSIALTPPSCRFVVKPCMKSSTSVLALRSLPALEVIGSDSDLVARTDLGLRSA